ncbi:PucR family transcriptional regulator [Galactobacter caseinivorans]|uniref:PucR family transcriptional regulator n=2 Tax=Galactobacter caseinivorans TaxID=2676123 RepID=A0A496PH44_9MICC|nr:PucR family transcriptional regulator [Galactobacter caseinivorans]
MPEQRSALGLVAQHGIAHFVDWYEDPSAPAWVLDGVFGDAPTELSRTISLQKALQLIRVMVGVVEERVPELADPDEQVPLREAVLLYSREVAFAAAEVYARAAEKRGAWDSRLEALVVDAVLRGEAPDALRSRLSAVGWRRQTELCVVVGFAPSVVTGTFVQDLRRSSVRSARESVVGIQGDRLILLLGGVDSRTDQFDRLAEHFGDGPVVVGPVVPTLKELAGSARAALAGLAAAPAWPEAPRPVAADDLWPERAMGGDTEAIDALVKRVYRPLLAAGPSLTETLSRYLSEGHSLEATARGLYVHANTVRYRLRRITDATGWDPFSPRDAQVLQSALIAGRLADASLPRGID